jgi:hypothetical protein
LRYVPDKRDRIRKHLRTDPRGKKEGGTKTELRVKRVLQNGPDIPGIIEELTVTARLALDKYERRSFGMFRVTLKRLVLVADETAIDCADGVTGPITSRET